MHFYAQLLSARFLDSPRCRGHVLADREGKRLVVLCPMNGAENIPGMRRRTLEWHDRQGCKCSLQSDYDGNNAGKIVSARTTWRRRRNVTSARNRRLPFVGSRLQLAEQRDSCIDQIGHVGPHFGRMQASNRCELCLERRRNILGQKNEGGSWRRSFDLY
jgi:hypothetical protein